MQYASNADLPEVVRRHVPPHGQALFRAAFNCAIECYEGDQAAAVRVAWLAVRRAYQRVGIEWYPRHRFDLPHRTA